MKSLKLFAVLGLLLSFAACKKETKTATAIFDPTQYYITGEGIDNYATSYAFIFKPNAMAYMVSWGGKQNAVLNYTYEAGTLAIGSNSFIFFILNHKITSSNNPNVSAYHLEKIPDTDAFSGKTFKGTVATNGLANGKSCLVRFTTSGKFTVSIDGFAQTGTGADYTLQNNGVATANTGNEGRLHLMSIGEGKLYYSQYNAVDDTHYYGILNRQ